MNDCWKREKEEEGHNTTRLKCRSCGKPMWRLLWQQAGERKKERRGVWGNDVKRIR